MTEWVTGISEQGGAGQLRSPSGWSLHFSVSLFIGFLSLVVIVSLRACPPRSLKEYEKISAVFFLASILIQSGCALREVQNKGEDVVLDAVLVINPSEGFDSARPVVTEVYLDGKYLGKTPIRFTPRKRKELGLPEYKRVDLDDKRHWMTWDLDAPGELRLAHPETRETKQILKLKMPKRYEQDARFTGMYGNPIETGDGIRLSVRIQQNKE